MKKGVDYIAVGVCTFCHDGKGRFVMVKRSPNARDEHGTWDLGGAGGIEFGDSAEATIRKEVKEEINADVVGFEFIGYRDILREQNGQKTHWVQLDFKVLVDPKTVKNNEPHKFDDLKWVTLDDLPAPLHSQFPKFLEKYRLQLQSQ